MGTKFQYVFCFIVQKQKKTGNPILEGEHMVSSYIIMLFFYIDNVWVHTF